MSERDPLETAKSLRGNVDSAAGHVRRLYLSFLAAAVYIGVIIGSTSDEQLLRLDPVTLPILGVGLPIVAFYALVPWLFVLLHSNILLQHFLLSRKLHLYAAALSEVSDRLQREAERTQLFSFAFSHLLVPGREGGLMRLLYGVMVWSTLIVLPLGVLLWAQVRFLPYHDPVSTWSQRAALLADVALLWVFWPRTLLEHDRFKDQLRALVTSLKAVPLTVTSVVAVVVSCFAAQVPGEGLERAGLRISLLVEVLFDSPNAPFHRSLELPEAVLVQGGASPEAITALRSTHPERHVEVLPQIAGLVLANRDLRYADLRGAILAKADLRGAALDGARLSGANLSFANIGPYETAPGGRCASGHEMGQEDIDALGDPGNPIPFWRDAEVTRPADSGRAKLCRATLKSVSAGHVALRQAVLSFAVIEDASFQQATMTSANLSNAILHRVSIADSDLEGARFSQTDATGLALDQSLLRQAKFSGARLANSSLESAVASEGAFDGAMLRRVNASRLIGDRATFEGASLEEVSLANSVLSRAAFDRAQLSDVDFTAAKLARASFKRSETIRLVFNRADLEFVDFTGLDLSGSALERARLLGTTFSGTKLVGVDAREVVMTGVSMVGEDLRGADLSRARIRGSDLTAVDLRGSRLTEADLLGVFLKEANLQGAALEQARFRGVDLSNATLDPHFLNRRLRRLGKAKASAALNLSGVRFEVMTEEERAAVASAASATRDRTGRPWRIAEVSEDEKAPDWEALREIAYCADERCLDLKRFSDSFASALKNYACKDPAGQKVILRRFGHVRGDPPPTTTYKREIVTRLVAGGCDPGGELTRRLDFWRGLAQPLSND